MSLTGAKYTPPVVKNPKPALFVMEMTYHHADDHEIPDYQISWAWGSGPYLCPECEVATSIRLDLGRWRCYNGHTGKMTWKNKNIG